MKRILCFLLCVTFLFPMLLTQADAQDVEFHKVRIDAGGGICVEKAILEEDELYIAASSFGRYTRYHYDRETNTFLIDGQEADKAFKRVLISPEKKKAAVFSISNIMIDLKNCYVIDGEVYLPFCQMMPILNAEIICAEKETIYVSNNDLSMAELLYNFSLTECSYNLAEEFKGTGDENRLFFKTDESVLGLYVMPSYLFNTVVDFRFDRLDIFLNSGEFEDYRQIFRDYLRDDQLFNKATSEIDDYRTIMRVVTGINKETKKLNNLVDWFRKIEDTVLKEDSPLNKDKLVRFIQSGEKYPRDNDDIISILTGAHQKEFGVSTAEVMELVEYLYICYNHVEDNQQMLDAVYNAATAEDVWDAQYLAAREVYNIYGNGWKTIPAMGHQVIKELLINKAKDSLKNTKLKLYELTAKVGGEILELAIPGSTKDVALLIYHAGVVNAARSRAGSGVLDTEQSTENYRLSLLLLMMASRKCYSIMATVAEGYGYSAADYRAKIEKLENLIMGLYLVAENARFDTYEHFGSYAEANRKLLKEGGAFDTGEIFVPGDMIGPEEQTYLDFLQQHPEYTHYFLLDVNGDGCRELLASEDNGSPHSYIDLWVFNGSFILAQEDMWAKYTNLYYSKENRWIEETLGGTGGAGVLFYYMDENYRVQTKSAEYYDWCGYLYNGLQVTDEALQEKLDTLMEKYHPETSEEIVLIPISSDTQQPEEDPYQQFLQENSQYGYYALLDINGDGNQELLATEIAEPGEQKVDIWLHQKGAFTLGYADICVIVANLTYNAEYQRLENIIVGAMGGGMEFFTLDDTMTVQRTSFEHYEWCGALYNGEVADDWEEYEAYEALEDSYDPEKSVEITFQQVQ